MSAHTGLPGAKLFGQGQSLTYDDVIFLPGHIEFGADTVRSHAACPCTMLHHAIIGISIVVRSDLYSARMRAATYLLSGSLPWHAATVLLIPADNMMSWKVRRKCCM